VVAGNDCAAEIAGKGDTRQPLIQFEGGLDGGVPLCGDRPGSFPYRPGIVGVLSDEGRDHGHLAVVGREEVVDAEPRGHPEGVPAADEGPKERTPVHSAIDSVSNRCESLS